MRKKTQVEGLLEMMSKETGYTYHLVQYGGAIYGIVDLNNFGRIVKRGTLSYLLGFCEGFLYRKD